MYIVKWLTNHPIVAIWALTLLALVLSMNGGKQHQSNIAANEAAKVAEQTTAKSESTSEKHADGAENMEEEGEIAGLDQQSISNLLLMAREAYWNDGLDEAVAIYQQLIEREPNVVSHKGELANVYWKQNLSEKSAALYAEIAIPMIESGKADRVVKMVEFIKQFLPEKAVEIEKRLQGLVK